MTISISSLDEFNAAISKNTSLLAYFSQPSCSVCDVIKPHVKELITSIYPQMASCYINIQEIPEISGQLQVFTVPTVIVFFEGKEAFRKSRSFGITELSDAIKRPYEMFYEGL